MKTKFLIIIPVLILIYNSGTEAQNFKSVTGIVTAFGKVPLNNVRVLSAKSRDVVYTDSTGIFSIKSSDKDILTIYATGFVTKRTRIRKENFYRIDLNYVDNLSNFNEAVTHGHISENLLREAVISTPSEIQRDYSKYKTIFELIASEFYNVRVNGTSVVNTKRRSMNQSQQVLYVVNGKIVPDISFVLTDDVKKIEFIDDVGATMYGVQGANGVIKITLK